MSPYSWTNSSNVKTDFNTQHSVPQTSVFVYRKTIHHLTALHRTIISVNRRNSITDNKPPNSPQHTPRPAPSISQSLATQGYYTTTSLLPPSSVSLPRIQAIELQKSGRYEPSWSERLEGRTIKRFDKKGVIACEPDGGDYFTVPDLISYVAALLQTLPAALNEQPPTRGVVLRDSAFNAKLAVTSAGGSKYPLYIDNPVGNGMDARKLTAILYLNPGWVEGMGGEIRLFVMLTDGQQWQLYRSGGDCGDRWGDRGSNRGWRRQLLQPRRLGVNGRARNEGGHQGAV